MRKIIVLGCVFVAVLFGLSACDTIMTETPTAGDDFVTPFDGLSHNLNFQFAIGDENFERAFLPEEGVGPIFNNVSCEGCHPGDGRGSPDLGFFRFSNGADLAFDLGGPQHQDKALPGVPLEEIPPGVNLSFRMPPPVFGVGLLESIPEGSILANEDIDDDDGDGISGRANMVLAPGYVSAAYVGGGPGDVLGRFSRKAQVSSLLQQVAEAYHGDMGITSDFIPEENPHPQAGSVAAGDRVADPEIPASTVLETVMYVRLLQPPQRGATNAEVERGEALFTGANCSACHIPTLRTGPNNIPQLSEKDVHAYSDLLLHDMGPGLADLRPDGDADGTEWRTAPLWGTRLVEDFLGGEAFYLHDGRANTLDDAILEHGGESQAARDAYAGMSESDQAALIAFLKSL
jgi:CxxC motif-containing protein (DUF1111 family)